TEQADERDDQQCEYPVNQPLAPVELEPPAEQLAHKGADRTGDGVLVLHRTSEPGFKLLEEAAALILIIRNDQVGPEKLRVIDVPRHAVGPADFALRGACTARRGIKGHPVETRNEHLAPGVRVLAADDVKLPDRVVLAAAVAGHHAGR